MAEIAYLMGSDGWRNPFYTEAQGYFDRQKAGGEKVVVVPSPNGRSLTLRFVLDDLHKRATATPAKVFDTIHIVTHANASGGVEFALDDAQLKAHGPYTDAGHLRDAQAAGAAFKPYSGPAVTDTTTIRIDGCDIGRNAEFLRLFGLLFGLPKRTLGCVRVVMFMHEGEKYRMVPCRTWSVVWKPPAFPAGSEAQWVNFRQSFLEKASNKFGIHESEPLGFDAFERRLKPILEKATQVSNSTGGFFFQEASYLSYTFQPPPADNEAALRLRLRPTPTPVTGGTGNDDTTLPIVIGAQDYRPLNATDGQFDGKPARTLSGMANIVVLAQAMAADADIGNPEHYRVVTHAAPLTPSPGPKAAAAEPAPDGTWSPDETADPPDAVAGDTPSGSPLDDLRAALLAAGGDATLLDPWMARLGPAPDDAPPAAEEGGDGASVEEEAALAMADGDDGLLALDVPSDEPPAEGPA